MQYAGHIALQGPTREVNRSLDEEAASSSKG